MVHFFVIRLLYNVVREIIMRTSIIPTNEFQKEKFAELLLECKGNITVCDFAEKCGVSTSYMSKCLHGKLDKPPVLKTLYNISQAIDISYEKLGFLAGYSQEEIAGYSNSYEKLYRDFYTFSFLYGLYEAINNIPFEWHQIKSPNRNEYRISVDSEFFSEWVFINMLDAPIKNENKLNLYIQNQYLNLCYTRFKPNTVVFFVVDSKPLFLKLLEHDLYSLCVYLSVILIDGETVLDQDFVDTHLPYTPEIDKCFLCEPASNR